MPGLPQPLYRQIRQALFVCDEIGNSDQLWAILRTSALRPFVNGLKTANNPNTQVDYLIGDLTDRQLNTGENGLVLLLELLANRYDPGDARHMQLANLATTLQTAVTSVAPPPNEGSEAHQTAHATQRSSQASPPDGRHLRPLPAAQGVASVEIQHRYALLVGVRDYVDPNFKQLPHAVHDVVALEKVLTAAGYTVRCLHSDQADEKLKPTRDNIWGELENLADHTGPGDLLLAHFGGHGHLHEDKAYLITSQTRSASLQRTAINLDEFTTTLTNAKAQARILILDACHSGIGRSATGMDPDFERHVYLEAEGTATLAACRQQQVAYEHDQSSHGAFTYFLLEGLRGAANKSQHFVTFSALNFYVTDQVKRWAINKGLQQTPNASTHLIGDPPLLEKRSDYGPESLPSNSEKLSSLTSVSILAAAQKMTSQLVQDTLPRHNITQRDKFNSELQNFLESSARYAVITGSAGVGKSVVMAMQAHALLADGWATFLMPGTSFSLDYLVERIAKDGLGYVGKLEWRQVLVAPWQSQPAPPVKGLVLLIDALDQANSEAVAYQLTQFHNAIRSIPAIHIKLIVSCHNFAWEHKRLPFFQEGELLNHPSVRVIELSDFYPSELTNALHLIGAVELTRVRQPGDSSDPHVESLRELLKHPAIFRLYAERSKSSTKLTLPDISWSGLLIEYFQRVITTISAHCTFSTDAVQKQLILLAQMARQEKSRNFLLDKEMLCDVLPALRVDDTDPHRSPYAAMCELGLLVEFPLPAGRRSVRFAIADVASYLLSLALERDQKRQTEAALEQTLTDWLNESLNDFPLIDALLIWIDRLAIKPRDRVLQLLLSKIIESYIVRIDVAFRLLRPGVLEALFEIVASAPLDHFYRYRDASKSLRFSTEMGVKACKRLYSHSSQVRQLAVHYLGQNRVLAATTQLIELLEDEDRDTRECIYRALARIGEPALQSLLAVISNLNESFDKRRRCLRAIGEIGIRNEGISLMLSGCFEESLEADNKQLLRSALQTASALRDRRQIFCAIRALGINDWDVVRDAAKLLTELPSVDALPALQDAFRRTSVNGGSDIWQKQAASQILAAIAAIQTADATAYALEKLIESIKENGGLHSVFVLSTAWNIPGVDSVFLEILLQSLANDPSGNSSGLGFDWLEQRWLPQQLLEIAQSAQTHKRQGNDIIKLTVDAIVASEAIQHSHHLYDHHKRVKALHVLAKCQPSNFVEEVTRLLECPGRWHFDEEVCHALWIAADERAEPALIRRLEQLMAQPETPFHEFTPVLRALGTCGSKHIIPLLLNYLRNATMLDLYTTDECLYPLVLRKKIELDVLVELVNDEHAQPSGRVVALMTLGMFNAKEYSALFDTMLLSPDESLVLSYAASMAGLAGNSASIPHLRRLIRNTRDVFTANKVAEALAALDAVDAVSIIENLFESNYADTEHTLGFINALEHFRQPSLLQTLLDVLTMTRYGHTQHAIIEALGAFLPHPSAKAKIMEWLEIWHGANSDSGRQRTAVRTLAQYSRQTLIEEANRLYADGRLYPSTRREIAQWLPVLAKQTDINHSELMTLAKRVLCDTNFAVREVGGEALAGMDEDFCRQIYNSMRAESDEWSQACAVRTLGFWGDHESIIEQFRYAERFHTRYFADVALAKCAKRRALAELVQQYQSQDGLTRLSAYLAIRQHGTHQTIRTLGSTIDTKTLLYIFLRELSHDVYKRVEKEYDDGAKEEEKVFSSVGTVYYD